MLIVWFFLSIKSVPNLLFGVLCLPGDRSHPVAQPTINPLPCCICWAGLLGRVVFPPWNKGPNSGSYNTSYRLNCKWDTGLYKIWLIIVKETVTMTTTGPCEMSILSPKFFGAGSKFPFALYVYNSDPICLSRIIQGGGWGGCHSTVKPAKKSFVIVST